MNAFHTGLAVIMTFSQQICFVNAIQPKFAAMETHGPPIHYAITALAPKLAAQKTLGDQIHFAHAISKTQIARNVLTKI